MTTQTLISAPVIKEPVEGLPYSSPVKILGEAAEPGATVEVAEAGGGQIFTMNVGPDGRWQGSVPLSKGPQQITARQLLGTSMSPWSPVRKFTVV